MPLPTVATCDIATDACCDSAFLTAEHLLNEVHTALLECVTADCPELPWKTYVTMGRADDAVLDSIAVAFVVGTPVVNEQNPLISPTRVTFEVSIRESGWPTAQIEGGRVVAPDPDRQNALARHAFAHGERMYRKLLGMKKAKSLIPSTVKGCSNVTLGPLTPMPPLGGAVGWRVEIGAIFPWP